MNPHREDTQVTRAGKWRVGGLAVVGAAVSIALGGAASAHQTPTPGDAGEPRRLFGMVLPDTMLRSDLGGFVPIFDGTLNGWDGDRTFWRAENNTIVGESTPAKVVERNTFLIWRGGRPRDFELKAEIRLSGTNSGIQFRSREMP